MENPCEKCPIVLKCGPGLPITPDMCTDYGLWIAAQSDLTALRAEVEVMRRAVENFKTWLQGGCTCLACYDAWIANGGAISEARKGEG